MVEDPISEGTVPEQPICSPESAGYVSANAQGGANSNTAAFNASEFVSHTYKISGIGRNEGNDHTVEV